MESFRVNSENENWYAGGILLMIVGVVEMIIMIWASLFYAKPTTSWIIAFLFMMVGGVFQSGYGYRMMNDVKKKYVIFYENLMEVHNYEEIRKYELSQVKEIKELTVNGGSGHRILYVFTMEDGYQFHISKDYRVKALFPGYNIVKKKDVKLVY